MLGSYTVTFYAAGAVLIIGASIISLMAFVKQQPEDVEEILETPSYGEKLQWFERGVTSLSWIYSLRNTAHVEQCNRRFNVF